MGWEESEIKANANTTLATANESDRQSGATYGIGGRWNFSKNMGLFAEWMKNDKIEVDSYLVGIDFRFSSTSPARARRGRAVFHLPRQLPRVARVVRAAARLRTSDRRRAG